MLSGKVLTRQNVGRLANYYEDGADDYYAKEGDAARWYGQGAAELGLEGAIDHEAAHARFRQLLAGEVDPEKGGRRFGRAEDKERIGIDLTFSAPKSVSLQALVSGDAAIIQAHDRAVAKAMEAAETMAMARQKKAGRTNVEQTGKLVAALFRHETSREKDPTLHTHAVVMNLTKRADGEWRALKNDEIVKHIRYLGAVYRGELALELQQAGYELRHGKDGMFELAHISRDQLGQFSRRSQQIEERLAEKGLTRETATSAQKQAATMQTRAYKDAGDRDTIHADWQRRARDAGIDFQRRGWTADHGIERTQRTREQMMAPSVEQAAQRAVRYAINHISERSAVMTERELVEVASNHAIGTTRISDIEKEVREQRAKGFLVAEAPRYKPADGTGELKTRQALVDELTGKGMTPRDARTRVDQAIIAGRLVKGDQRLTTQTALAREQRVLAIERDGRGQLRPIMDAPAIDKALGDRSLTPGQRQAVSLILSNEDRVVGVQGKAGTGKSYMLGTAIEQIEAQGYSVRGLAPYGSQVKALREEGVQANTLASFLKAKEKGIDARTVIVLDEAGVVPARQMDQLLKLVEQSGSRIVLLGDTGQTKAIEAGRPFDQLQAAGMRTATMDDIQRQKNPLLREAVELAAAQRTGPSLDKIEVVHSIRDDGDRRRQMVRDFAELAPDVRDRTIIVAGTNEARHELNTGIRVALDTAGKGVSYDTLARHDSTIAERQFSKNYRVGDVIHPERDYPRAGLRRGELYRVLDTGPGNRLTVEHTTSGDRSEFSPRSYRSLSVYEAVRAELAPGDRVRITRNDAALDISLGDRFTVERVTAATVTLANDRGRRVELPADKPLHVDYAYASTVHSSQGLTTDRVMIEQQTKSRTTASDVYYVAISRARHEAPIYTDGNRAELEKAIARQNVKHAALDLDRRSAPSFRTPETRPTPRREPSIDRGREKARQTPAEGRQRVAGTERAGMERKAPSVAPRPSQPADRGIAQGRATPSRRRDGPSR